MTQPTAFAPTTTKTRTTTPVAPATPSAFSKAPPSAFTSKPTAFSSSAFTAAAFAAAPAAPAFTTTAFGRLAKRPRKVRKVYRRVLPTLGAARNVRRDRLCTPWEEVCCSMEWSPWTETVQPGWYWDFDDFAQAQASYEVMNNGTSPCEQMNDGWCIRGERDDDDDPFDPTHMHPLYACELEADESPLGLIDANGWVNDSEAEDHWEMVLECNTILRRWMERHYLEVLGIPALGSTIALEALKVAGFEFPDGLYRGDSLCQLVSMNFDEDQSLRDALCDLTIFGYPHQLADGEDAPVQFAQMAALVEEDGFEWRHPDDLQFLTFDPAEFPLMGDGSIARLRGPFVAVDATYQSILRPPWDDKGWMFMSGWREIQMKRGRA